MSLVFCGLSPHPPLLVPEIGRDSVARVEHTREALQRLSARLVERAPETLVLITPHGPMSRNALSILAAERFTVSFNAFGWEAEMRGDAALAQRIVDEAARVEMVVRRMSSFDSPSYPFSRGLDHASMVPLYYFREAGLDCRLVVISIAPWSHRVHFDFGRALHRAIEGDSTRVALVASGDLSHRLIPSAPAGYDALGVEFDRRVVADLEGFDTRDLLALEDDFIERIGECGLRPIGVLFGAMQARVEATEVLSYEGPFGVGYCVAEIGVRSPVAPQADAVLALVRETVESFVRGDPVPPLPSLLPAGLERRGAAFVCLKKNGVLRGCIGTVLPTQDDLAHELQQNAVSAASRDPRFPPVLAAELGEISYSVDVLDEPEPVESVDALDPAVYGVIVKSGSRSAVLLPNIEGIDTAQEQVDTARRKAGIGTREPLALQRFRAHRYERKD